MSSALALVAQEGYSIDRYANRDDWLQGRSTCIGGSDIAALFKDPMGRSMNPWKSAYKLWAEKTGHDVVSEEESEAMYWGRVFEAPIADWYAMTTGRKLEYDGPYTIHRSKKHPHRGVSIDRRIVACDNRGPGILSVKNVGFHRRSDWDAAGLDEDTIEAIMDGDLSGWEPPDHQHMQLQYELGITGCTWGSFAVCIGGQKGVWVDVERDDEFIQLAFDLVDEMWDHIKKLTPPEVDGDKHTTEALKRMWRVEDGEKVIQLSKDAQAWTDEIAKIEPFIKAANTRKEHLRNALREEMKDAVVGELPNGGVWRWKTTRAGIRDFRRLK